MIEHNWLVTYSTIDGIGLILAQMNQRTKFKSKMDESVNELREFYDEFKDEFYRFFAELETFSEKRKKEILG